MNNISYLTQEGYDKIKGEIDYLKTTARQEAAKAIAEAREKGDLSENAEYHAAKDAQGMLEMKINELEKKIINVRILDQSNIDTSRVSMMTFVRLKNHKMNKELTYQIVGEAEADIKAGKISVTSPIGAGLLGKVLGENAKIITPAGEMILEILEITS
ncbi:MAG: transcription elongation factor GreA [Saprospiraceae bacterium]|jgi:transcription elongation factor GreA|nr:transcription elongation factor GreA [Saprospiraceae bacterium]MBK7465510.1 transcription elongation factor GreA [Saprospiraceae bacterium]MBK9992475.1 transcription elongation factor GreA [Saprospiraceae bacterium]